MGNTFRTGKLINGLYVDDNGNVGIGTTTMSDRLTISGNTTVLGSINISSYLNFTSIYGGVINGYTGTTSVPMSYSASQHTFNTGGTARLFINSSGNVGIGTSSPVSLLNIHSGDFTIQKNAIGTGTEVGNINFRNDYMGAYTWAQIKGVNGANHDFSNITFSTTHGFNSISEKMRISSNGNIGIGTTSPGSKLHLYDGTNPISLKIQRTSVPVYLSDVQPAGTTAASCWSHNVESTSNGSSSWGGFANGSYAGSAIMLNANTGTSWITFLAAPSANTNPTERFRIFGTNGYSNAYKYIGNLSSTSLSSLSDAQVQRYYFDSLCNNTWRTLIASINQRHFFLRIWGSDAGTFNYGEYYFTMSFPGYGVSNNANLHYASGGWNTGGFELSYTNTGSDYYLIFRNTSYYSSSNTATYLIEITAA